MPTVLKELLSSKKFLFVCGATLFTILAWKAGWIDTEYTSRALLVLCATYLGAQGVADIGAKLAQGKVFEAELYSEVDAEAAKQKNKMIQTVAKSFADGLIAGLEAERQRTIVPPPDPGAPARPVSLDTDPPPTPPSRL